LQHRLDAPFGLHPPKDEVALVVRGLAVELLVRGLLLEPPGAEGEAVLLKTTTTNSVLTLHNETVFPMADA
jgi:hypothetical protein